MKVLLDRVFDRTAIGKTVLPLSDGGKVGELLSNANRIGFAYMLAGTGFTEFGKVNDDPKALEQAERNMAQFAPEIGRWFDFQMVIQGALADSTIAYLASAKKEALERPLVRCPHSPRSSAN